MKYAVLLSLFVLFFQAGPAFADLPLPPSGATYIQFNPGAPEGSGAAKIYIWYDSSTLYMRIEPVNGFDLLWAPPLYLEPGTQEIKSTYIEDEYGGYLFYPIYSAQTFYLYPSAYGELFPSASTHTTLKFQGDGTSAYAFWPEDFTGQSYTGVCDCPAASGGVKVVVVPLLNDSSARSREEEATPEIFLDSSLQE